MPDVFISYKREDRPKATRLADALELSGLDVWYDFELISGDQYRAVIRSIIDQTAAVVVMWSPLSASSDFVLDEASHAKAQGKLCPVLIEEVAIPLGFGQLHTDDLISWDGDIAHSSFQRLLRGIQSKTKVVSLSASTQAPRVERQLELEAFKKAQLEGTTQALRAFLKACPEGYFAAIVRKQIASNAGIGRRLKWLSQPFSILGVVLFLTTALAGVYWQLSSQVQIRRAADPLPEAQLAGLVWRVLEASSRGECLEDAMSEPLLTACRTQAANLKSSLGSLGRIRDVKSEGMQLSASGYGTRFLITYERGVQRWYARGGVDTKLAAFWSD